MWLDIEIIESFCWRLICGFDSSHKNGRLMEHIYSVVDAQSLILHQPESRVQLHQGLKTDEESNLVSAMVINRNSQSLTYPSQSVQCIQ